MNNITKITTCLLLLFSSSLTIKAQTAVGLEDVYVILTSAQKTDNGGIYIYEYKRPNSKGYIKTYYFVDKKRNIYEHLSHYNIDKRDLAPDVKFVRDKHWMDVKRLSTKKAKSAIDIDVLYPTWNRKEAKAFFRTLTRKRVWVIDRSDNRNNSSSMVITQTQAEVGGY